MWLKTQRHWDVPLLTVVPEDSRYPHYLLAGSSFFDDVQDRAHPGAPWLPLVAWLEQVFLELQDAVNFNDGEGASLALDGLPAGALDRPLRRDHGTASPVSSVPRGSVPGAAVSAALEADIGRGRTMGFDPKVPAYLRRARATGRLPEALQTPAHLAEPARGELSLRSHPVLPPSVEALVQLVLHDRPPKRWLARLDKLSA